MSAATGEALAHLDDHVGACAPQPSWLGRRRLAVATPTDRCLTLVDDAIAWVCASRTADATVGKLSTLPLLDFLR